MRKHKLEIEYDYDFILIGIATHEKDYRLCWAIGNRLGREFSRHEDIPVAAKKKSVMLFSAYHSRDEETFTDFYIIANKCATGMLAPEQKKSDFFLMVKGNVTDEEKQEVMRLLKEINFVLAAYEVKPDSLRSKQHFLFA